jgi:hypothetical protein
MTSFTMTREEARDLAAFIERIRSRLPGDRWHKPGIEDALGRARDRASAPDLALAAIRAASEPMNRTPAVIGMDGPHWREASKPPHPEAVSSEGRCSICSQAQDKCRSLRAGDHEFESVVAAKRRKEATAAESVAERVAAVKSELAPTSGPTARKTLADMAEANPELHARIERLRAENPGLAAPPMQEPEPPPPTPPACDPTNEAAGVAAESEMA